MLMLGVHKKMLRIKPQIFTLYLENGDELMKFNPNTRQLFTNEGVLIKRLHCPRGVKWRELRHSDSIQKYCYFCEKNIIDIQNFDDEAVLAIAMQDTSVCLKLDLNDSNIRIINHNVY
jgi:hypothetical protein